MFKRTLVAAVTAAAALITAAPALAAEATASVNVRTGPGTQYRVVDTLRPGEPVDIRQCASNGWCEISHSGPDGWVSRNYLADDGRPSAPPSRGNGQPDVNFSVNTPGFSFSIGNGNDGRPGWGYPGRPGHPGYPGRPGRPGNDHGRDARVCFYADWNYRGDSFCVRPGQQDARLTGAWNDRISSIRVDGRAEVTVCEDWNFRGRCATLRGDDPRLNGRNNDAISSYRVR